MIMTRLAGNNKDVFLTILRWHVHGWHLQCLSNLQVSYITVLLRAISSSVCPGPPQMIDFFFPNSRALLPTFLTNCANWSHFSQMGSHLAQNTTTNPCSLLSHHKPLFWICHGTTTATAAASTSPPRPPPRLDGEWRRGRAVGTGAAAQGALPTDRGE